jgi:acyl-CoA thioesterase
VEQNGLLSQSAAASLSASVHQGPSASHGGALGQGRADARDGAPPADQGDQQRAVAERIAGLRALLEQGLAEGVGVGHTLGIHLDTLEVGHSVWTLTPSPAAANAMFTVHGGVLATLMDTAMGSAVFTRLPADTYYTTLELKVNFVRPVSLTAPTLTCVARTVHVGRRTATADCVVTAADGKLAAHGSCTCLLTGA